MVHKRNTLFHQFLVLSFVICCSIGLAFCAMLFYVHKYSIDQNKQVLENLHKQTLLRVEEYYSAIENETYVLSYSPTLQSYIQTDDLSEKINMQNNLKSLYSGAYLILDSLMGIASFDLDGKLVRSSGTSLFIQDGLPDSLSDLTRYYYTGVYMPDVATGIRQNSFALLSPTYNQFPGSRLLGDKIGTIALTFNTNHLTAIIKSIQTSDLVYLILTDADGQIIASSSNRATAYYETDRTDTVPAAFVEETLDGSGWHLYSYLPHAVVLTEIKPLIAMITLTGIVFLLLLALLILTLKKKILRPISQLGGFMARVPEDTTPVRFQTTDDNELGTMIRIMNEMLDNLEEKNELIRNSEAKMYAMEISKKDMEILAYRNQINPHFLYNTLDCICSMAMFHGSDDIAQISEALSTMFRYAVKGNSFACVEQELAYVNEYASIISYRFMNRIAIKTDAAPETLTIQTIKLLIQPLVENAVFHGLERQIGPGTVSVTVSLKDNGFLFIRVHDDGIGIPSDALETLRESIREAQSENLPNPSSEKSIGLRNIARRIHLYYGKSGCIQLDSTEGSGTTVTLTLPPMKGDSLCTKS